MMTFSRSDYYLWGANRIHDSTFMIRSSWVTRVITMSRSLHVNDILQQRLMSNSVFGVVLCGIKSNHFSNPPGSQSSVENTIHTDCYLTPREHSIYQLYSWQRLGDIYCGQRIENVHPIFYRKMFSCSMISHTFKSDIGKSKSVYSWSTNNNLQNIHIKLKIE
jgi:hypothetical protein